MPGIWDVLGSFMVGLELCEGQAGPCPWHSNSTLQWLGSRLLEPPGLWACVEGSAVAPGYRNWHGEAPALGLSPGYCFPVV